MAVGFKPVGHWKRLSLLLDPERYSKALERNVRKATKFNAMLIVREIRNRIKSGSYSANAALTVFLKQSTKPLIGPGDAELFKAITHEMINSFNAFIGVLRTARNKAGEPLVNVAEAIHEGVTIAVTPEMRGLFLLLAEATKADAMTFNPPMSRGMKRMKSAGRYDRPAPSSATERLTGRAKELYDMVKGRGIIKPLKPTTTAIVIPPRAFIREVFEDPAIIKQCQLNWSRAVAAAQGSKGTAEEQSAATAEANRKMEAAQRRAEAPPREKSSRHVAAGKLGWERRRARMNK